MKTCPNCSNQQGNGKFCGKCGSQIEEVTNIINESTSLSEETPSATRESANNVNEEIQQTNKESVATINIPNQNDQLETIKTISKGYFNTIVKQLKNPTDCVRTGNTSFINSLISVILFSIVTAISLYALINNKMNAYFGFSDIFEMSTPTLPFFKTVITITFVLLLFIAITILSVFITAKIFSEGPSFKRTIEEMGAYYSIALIAAVLNLLFGLMGSLTMVILCTVLGLIIVFGVIPGFTIMQALHKKTIHVDRFNAYCIFFSISLVLNYLLCVILYNSVLENIIGTVQSLLNADSLF